MQKRYTLYIIHSKELVATFQTLYYTSIPGVSQKCIAYTYTYTATRAHEKLWGFRHQQKADGR